MTKTGLFIGLITLDLTYLTAQLPSPNQKQVALDYTIAAGGPATNAAIAFSHFQHTANLLGVVGCHPLSQFVHTELEQWQVHVFDLNPQQTTPLPTSSILVTQSTGERAVISLNAVRSQATIDQIPVNVLQDVAIVLIDGHQMDIGSAIAQQAKASNILVVVDGGSWKPGFESILQYADYAICSANFHPPQVSSSSASDIFDYLTSLGIKHSAITNGSAPIEYCQNVDQNDDRGEILVPQIQAVDTLGAGDIFHGAFCHYILHLDFVSALTAAAEVASLACTSFGTRQWLLRSPSRQQGIAD
jgi:sugar/nucleoside kinase (ribokinase family)